MSEKLVMHWFISLEFLGSFLLEAQRAPLTFVSKGSNLELNHYNFKSTCTFCSLFSDDERDD